MPALVLTFKGFHSSKLKLNIRFWKVSTFRVKTAVPKSAQLPSSSLPHWLAKALPISAGVLPPLLTAR